MRHIWDPYLVLLLNYWENCQFCWYVKDFGWQLSNLTDFGWQLSNSTDFGWQLSNFTDLCWFLSNLTVVKFGIWQLSYLNLFGWIEKMHYKLHKRSQQKSISSKYLHVLDRYFFLKYGFYDGFIFRFLSHYIIVLFITSTDQLPHQI